MLFSKIGEWAEANYGMMAIFAEFATRKKTGNP